MHLNLFLTMNVLDGNDRINSTFAPTFKDANSKYINAKPIKVATVNETTTPIPKPLPYEPTPPKTQLLPKRIIAVFGPSSDTKFLASALATATGVFPKEGMWMQILAPNPQNSTNATNPLMRWIFANTLSERASTSDGELEIQHLSLPMGSSCPSTSNTIQVVEALVPKECQRYETLPNLDSKLAEQVLHNQDALQSKNPPNMTDTVQGFHWEEEQILQRQREKKYLEQCRNEVNISQRNNATDAAWTCGAVCGRGEYDGYALYPDRYFVNITSHIEWYQNRGVDISVVIVMRDQSISRAANQNEHCSAEGSVEKEEEMTMSLVHDAIEKNGIRGHGEKQRVFTVSYEAMMMFKETYLFDLYHEVSGTIRVCLLH